MDEVPRKIIPMILVEFSEHRIQRIVFRAWNKLESGELS